MSRSTVVVIDDRLEELATEVRCEYKRSREALGESLDAYLVVGHCLREARGLLPSDPAFGAWFRVQEFGFSRQWALILRTAAEHESEVRAVVTTQVVTGGSPNIKKAVKQVTAGTGGTRGTRPPLGAVEGIYPTIVIDPPWQYGNTATRAAAEDHYPTMNMDELAALEIPAADDAHLYLWVTNSFIREGFDLLDAWDFTYKTTLTWCKPSIGMGNYFRVNTEHVLFAVRGRQPTQINNVGTWFEADRGKHSSKPESFYDLVEKASPGPWFEMFARRRRMGDWHYWGNES